MIVVKRWHAFAVVALWIWVTAMTIMTLDSSSRREAVVETGNQRDQVVVKTKLQVGTEVELARDQYSKVVELGFHNNRVTDALLTNLRRYACVFDIDPQDDGKFAQIVLAGCNTCTVYYMEQHARHGVPKRVYKMFASRLVRVDITQIPQQNLFIFATQNDVTNLELIRLSSHEIAWNTHVLLASRAMWKAGGVVSSQTCRPSVRVTLSTPDSTHDMRNVARALQYMYSAGYDKLDVIPSHPRALDMPGHCDHSYTESERTRIVHKHNPIIYAARAFRPRGMNHGRRGPRTRPMSGYTVERRADEFGG